MVYKLLIVVSSGGFRLGFAKRLAQGVIGLGAKCGIVFLGNSLYGLRQKPGSPLAGLEGAEIMAHGASLAERGIAAFEIVEGARQIGDDELLELMITSEKTICI
jgi:hypothetical protein